jgi:hypothetical protein
MTPSPHNLAAIARPTMFSDSRECRLARGPRLAFAIIMALTPFGERANLSNTNSSFGE